MNAWKMQKKLAAILHSLAENFTDEKSNFVHVVNTHPHNTSLSQNFFCEGAGVVGSGTSKKFA
jgi:hypothetical protein